MKFAIIYAREKAGENVYEQVDACRAFAEANNLTPTATVVDLLMDGPAYRLGLRGALDMVKAGDIPVLVAMSQDHVSKDAVRFASLQETLSELNCAVMFVQAE
jgi:DNA invertase Pin-like site-specific DNA recombinase